MRFLAALKIRVLQDTHKRNIAVVTRSDIFPLSMTLRKRMMTEQRITVISVISNCLIR